MKPNPSKKIDIRKEKEKVINMAQCLETTFINLRVMFKVEFENLNEPHLSVVVVRSLNTETTEIKLMLFGEGVIRNLESYNKIILNQVLM